MVSISATYMIFFYFPQRNFSCRLCKKYLPYKQKDSYRNEPLYILQIILQLLIDYDLVLFIKLFFLQWTLLYPCKLLNRHSELPYIGGVGVQTFFSDTLNIKNLPVRAKLKSYIGSDNSIFLKPDSIVVSCWFYFSCMVDLGSVDIRCLSIVSISIE